MRLNTTGLRLRILTAAVAIALLGCTGVASADAAPMPPSHADTALHLPDTMTDADMQALLATDNDIIDVPDQTDDGSGLQTSLAGGDRCFLDPGAMWQRKSGSNTQFGTIGSKPRLRDCTAGVRTSKLESSVYKRSGDFWSKVAGPFVSWGTGNMIQRSVAYRCAGTDRNTFKVISLGSGTNTRGDSAIATDSTGEFSFDCSSAGACGLAASALDVRVRISIRSPPWQLEFSDSHSERCEPSDFVGVRVCLGAAIEDTEYLWRRAVAVVHDPHPGHY